MRLTILMILLSFQGISQTYSANTKADILHILSESKKNGVTQMLRDRFPINTFGGQEFVSFVAKSGPSFDRDLMENQGVMVGSKIKDIVSIKYPLARLGDILNESGLAYIQIAGKIKPMLNKVPIGTRADSVWAGIGLPESYTGKDVIIGVNDWGFDYSSPMFYDTLLQNTRILAAWDQFKTSGPAPAPYGYGAEYTSVTDLMNAQSDTANIYSYGTHGTHVAGIAGGSGAGTEYRGIGFESEFLFTTFLVDESAVLDSWEWMYNKATAAGKRLIINMSWGLYHINAIDGTSPLSQALDAYSAQGVVFVTSAGNNGNVDFHIKHDFAGDTIQSRIEFYTSATLSTLWGQSIHMWGEAGNEFSGGFHVLNNQNQVVAQSPMYPTASTPNYIDSFVVTTAMDTIWYNLSADAAFPTNGRPQIRMRVKRPVGAYKVIMKSTAPSGIVHYWNVTELTSDVGNWGMPFSTIGSGYEPGDNQYGIGAPACSYSAISVAAYASEYFTVSGSLVGGAPAAFSSYGPMMNDSLKPDVAAPGMFVTSSVSSYTNSSFNPITTITFNGRDYPFASFSGTSMSSPATAGVAALILDANPFLSPQQVKGIIINTARTDAFTGPIPPHSVKWGWGKVNAYAAVQLALLTVGNEELELLVEWSVYPNPASTHLNIQGLDGTLKNMLIIDQMGRVVARPDAGLTINVQALSQGRYILQVEHEGKVERVKFIKK